MDRRHRAAPGLPAAAALFKLGLRMNDSRFLKRFARARRPGAYLRILREGDIAARDAINLEERPAHGVTSALVSRALLWRAPTPCGGAHTAPALPADIRAWTQERAEVIGTR